MAAVHFDIQQWSVWAPQRAGHAETAVVPSLDFLPAMQRRRLSPLARACFHVCWQVISPEQPCGMVFCSRHGETQRTLDMLHDLQQGDPVSPTAFSHSVHNAIPALLSIARHDITEQVTVAQQGHDGLVAAFLEAGLMLVSGTVEQVIVICCDEPLPMLFKPQVADSADYLWAAAFRLTLGQGWVLNTTPVETLVANAAPYVPAPLQLADQLDAGVNIVSTHENDKTWHWRRLHA